MDGFNQMIDNPMFHLGLGLLGGRNATHGLQQGLLSYGGYQQGRAMQQQREQEQAQLEAQRQAMQAQGINPNLPEWMAKAQYEARFAQPEMTNIEKMLIAAGMKPGTPEFQKAVMQYALKPQNVIQNIPSPPTGYVYKDPTNPSRGLEVISGGPAEKPTEGQVMSQGFSTRMDDAESKIQELVNSGFDPGSMMEYGPASISNFLASPEYQTYRAAQEDWVRAKLRKESGAVISEEEMDGEIATYFPQPGDSQAVINRKAKQRQTAQAAIARAGGIRYYRDWSSKKPAVVDINDLPKGEE